jgi:hypothetical protein
MPTPFVRRYQKHVTIKLNKNDKITIIRPKQGVSLIVHPLTEENKQTPEYANISLLASDVLATHPALNDMNEKIDECLSKLQVVNDNTRSEISDKMKDPDKNKRGTANLYYYDSPELDGENDHLRSKLVKIRKKELSKQEVKHVNDLFINKFKFPHGLNESNKDHVMGELYSTNNV